MRAAAAQPRALYRRRVRPGRCYEVACSIVLDLWEDGVQGTLAHAVVYHHLHRRWIGHAWAEIDGSVYDLTIRREPYSFELYRRLYVTDPARVRRYTADEAARALLAAGHYGPWPGDPTAESSVGPAPGPIGEAQCGLPY